MADKYTTGLNFIVRLEGPILSESDKRLLGGLKPFGVLLLAKNFSKTDDWVNKFRDLVKSIREYTESNDITLTIDHEGGRVHRLPSPVTKFPYAEKYKGKAFEVGQAMASELLALGIDISFSPVCDINSNPKNPVIGERAFGTTPEEVSSNALSHFEGLKSKGIIACAKHFPGHGDTDTDSHKELPILRCSVDEIFCREIIPFKRLIEAGINMVMTSHILFESVDADVPVTLSKKFLDELLRKRLEYKNVVVSDDLDMKAATPYFKDEDGIRRSLSAGCDLFIVSRHEDLSIEKTLFLAKSLQKSNSKDLEKSHERILKLQDRRKRNIPCALDENIILANQELLGELD